MNLKYTNMQNRNRLTDTENILMVARCGRGGKDWRGLVKKVKGLIKISQTGC